MDEEANSEQVNEGFDKSERKNAQNEKEMVLEMVENGVRRRDVSFSNNHDQNTSTRKRSLNEHRQSYCFNSNGIIDNNILSIICPHKDSRGNPCKQCQKKDHLWYEKTGKSHPVDILSRFLFPICYVVFVLGYCIYYNLI